MEGDARRDDDVQRIGARIDGNAHPPIGNL
jgi:hypothetical protein